MTCWSLRAYVCLCVHVAVRLIVSGRACVNVFVRADACARVRGGVPAVVTMVGLFSYKKRRRFRRRFADTVFDVGCCRGSHYIVSARLCAILLSGPLFDNMFRYPKSWNTLVTESCLVARLRVCALLCVCLCGRMVGCVFGWSRGCGYVRSCLSVRLCIWSGPLAVA